MMRNILNYRLFLLQSLVIVLTIMAVMNFDWYADFWEHATVIRSFSQNLWSKQNPIINDDTINSFQTPYHWILGLISYLTKGDTLLVLRLSGIFNTILLFFCLNKLTKSLFPNSKTKEIQFYVLFFILFSTSISWKWSGFLDFYSLLITSCYPSVLANALFFLTMSYWIKFESEMQLVYFWKTTICLSTILLLHPLTAISAYIFILSSSIINISYNYKKKSIKFLFPILFFLISFSLLLSCIYPYFDIISLVKNNNIVLHNSNLPIFGLAIKIMPPLIFLIFIIYSFRVYEKEYKKQFQVFFLCIFLLAIICFYGFVSSKYSYGRVISQICILDLL